MLVTVSDFRRLVANDLATLVAQLQEVTGRRGADEEHAWRESLPAVGNAFSAPSFQPLHLYFGERGHLSLEYRLPAAAAWCDMILLGRHFGRSSAVVIELKDWVTRADKPGALEGLIQHAERVVLHPSEQVAGYTEYCRRYHSAILEDGAAIHGCVLFTREDRFTAYGLPPNKRLVETYPCFAARRAQTDSGMASFFANRISEPDEGFALRFETGTYRQDRSFIRQLAQQILDRTRGPFELIDGQRLGYLVCKSEIDGAVFSDDGSIKKTVVIVSGPPGSGKSVVASKIWATLAADERIAQGEVVICTTSKAQESNWTRTFRDALGTREAGGVVIAANQFAPASAHEVARWQARHPEVFADVKAWEENTRVARHLRPQLRMPDDHLLVTIVDEAHALINPEQPDARNARAGWPLHFGPQAYHIIRASTVSVFFLDPLQGFRERETTAIADIQRWASDLNARVLPVISLEGAQFRCGGSAEYVRWVDALLSNASKESLPSLASEWRLAPPSEVQVREPKVAEPEARYTNVIPLPTRKRRFEFAVFPTPAEMEDALRQCLRRGRSARLVASYARPWITEQDAAPHERPPSLQDFRILFRDRSRRDQVWARPWNVIPNRDDYSRWVQAIPGTRMSEDPLSEVGCPYAVRGFDFDYVGLLWFGDMRRRDGKWIVSVEDVHESGLRRHIQRARAETDQNGEHHRALLQKVMQAYRILLTRAIYGVYTWIEDEETRFFIEASLGAAH